jgi:hypothetical protein
MSLATLCPTDWPASCRYSWRFLVCLFEAYIRLEDSCFLWGLSCCVHCFQWLQGYGDSTKILPPGRCRHRHAGAAQLGVCFKPFCCSAGLTTSETQLRAILTGEKLLTDWTRYQSRLPDMFIWRTSCRHFKTHTSSIKLRHYCEQYLTVGLTNLTFYDQPPSIQCYMYSWDDIQPVSASAGRSQNTERVSDMGASNGARYQQANNRTKVGTI